MYKKNLVFAAACVGMLIFGIAMVSLGTINAYLTSRFQLDEITVASLAALLPFGILIGSLVFGPIVDKYSYKILLIVCSLIILLALEGIAITPDFTIIQLCFFLIGFGGGVLNGGTNALVADISTEGKGANLSLLGVFYGAGALGMPAVTGALSNYYSYESIISAIGFFILLPILFFAVTVFPLPKQPQGVPIKKGFALIKESSLIMLSLVLFFESGMEGIVNNWTTRYLQTGLNIEPGNALFALTILALSLTITRLILGGMLKKIAPYKIIYICIGFAFAGSVVLISGRTMSSSIAAMILLGIGFSAAFPVILGYIGELYSSLSGTAFSIALVIALVGNTIINYLVGVISQSYGIRIFPYVLLISIMLLTIIFFLSLRKISNKTNI